MAQFKFSRNIVLQIPRKTVENVTQGILSFCPEFEIVSLQYQIVTSVIFISYIKHSYSVCVYQISAQETFIFFAKHVGNRSNLNRPYTLFTRTQQKIQTGSSF